MSDIKNNIFLSEEEQERIKAEVPALYEGLMNGDPKMNVWLKDWRRRQEEPEKHAQAQGQEIRQEVAQATPKEAQLTFQTMLGYPTDMTRTSPFFPLNQRELGRRDFLREYVITAAGWGEITYTGPKLSIYEEDALMALLAVLDQVSNNKEETDFEGRKTYTYQGPVLPLLRILGYKRPNKKDYNRLISGLKLLTVAGVELKIASGKTKRGKQRQPRKTFMSAMLANVAWDEEKKELSATINPFFYEAFCQGQVTLYDLQTRIKLAGSVAKALYRFIQSHRTGKWQGHFLTLSDALNIDREQAGFRIKQTLRRAMTELKKQGIITKNSGIKEDVVLLERYKRPQKKPKKSIS